jgi:hypothetical protein
MQRQSTIVRAIWAVCLIIGGLNHARILIQNGLFWDYGGVTLGSAIYWSSLTIIDPTVAVLLFIRPKPGVCCTIVLIVTNVAHNLYVTASRATTGEFIAYAANPFVLSQIAFMAFVLASARIAWNGVGNAYGLLPVKYN